MKGIIFLFMAQIPIRFHNDLSTSQQNDKDGSTRRRLSKVDVSFLILRRLWMEGNVSLVTPFSYTAYGDEFLMDGNVY